jgi:hypothetical protein
VEANVSSVARRALPAVLLALLLSALPAGAEGPALVEVSGKAGLSMASFFWTQNGSWNDMTMFVFHPVAYAVCAVNITPEIAIQAELGYAGRGASIDASREYAHWYFNYVEVPVWIKFSSVEPKLRVYAGAGGYVAYMFGGDYDFDAPSVSLGGKGSLCLTGTGTRVGVPAVDYGLTGTCGVDIDRLLLELRFALGLSPVLDFTLPDGRRQSINADIQLLVGWRL